jgi:hypothetical protein
MHSAAGGLSGIAINRAALRRKNGNSQARCTQQRSLDRGKTMKKPTPITDARDFFYQLGEQMGCDPRDRKYPPGTGLEWALAQLSKKHAKKLTRAR